MKSGEQGVSLKSVQDELESLRLENEGLRDQFSILQSKVSSQTLLEESESRYRDFIDSSHELIQSIFPDGSFDFVNLTWLDRLGYSQEEIPDMNFMNIIHDVSKDHCMNLFERIMKGEDIDTIAATFVTKSGESLDIEGAIRVRKVDGVIIATHGIFQDVTTSKKLAEKVKVGKQLQDVMFEQNNIGVGILSVEGFWLQSNVKLQQMFGYSEKELGKLTFLDVTPSDFVEEGRRSLAAAIACDELSHWSIEKQYVKKDGSLFWCQVDTFAIYAADKKPLYMYTLIRDVNAEKVVLEELMKTLQDLKISNEELEQFAYVASHDLQEPVRLISTYASMLDEKLTGQLGHAEQRYMGFIQDSSRRMRDLIKGLLDFSLVGNHVTKLVSTSMKDLLDPVLLNFTKEINDYGAQVKVCSLPLVVCDKLQMSRLLQNLVGNAVKFSRDSEVPEVEILHSEDEQYHTIAICDNGIGIKEESLDKIFTIFKRLNNRGNFEGHGIGMSIAKKIVDLHGGKIWVESDFGKGSVVKFTLPKMA